MTVFKAFLKVIRKNIGTIILYTAIVIVFSVANTQTGENVGTFTGEKPAVCVSDIDNSTLSENFVKYIGEKTEISEIPEKDWDDALFYHEISCIIKIPKGFGTDTMSGKKPEIEIRTTGTPDAEFVRIMLQRYLRTQNTYAENSYTEREITLLVDKAMNSTVNVEIATSLDTSLLNKTAAYFNFAAYSIMSCIVFIICLVLSSFNDEMIRKRTIVSSMKHTKYSRDLLLSCCTYAVVVWIFFAAVGFFIVGSSLFSIRGALYIANTFLFSMTALSLAYMLSTILKEKNAVTGIVNVITLGCSFLCGIFVPAEYLPDSVNTAAHFLPAYWYVQSNNLLSEIESITITTATPVPINFSVLFGFFAVFFIIGMVISSLQRRNVTA